MRTSEALFVSAAFLLISRAVLTSAQTTSRPNVVLLILDDVGWADVGYHGSNFPTPTIDALAKDGIQLERMYAMP
jgi:arylsulfatase A-like enzyme